MISVAPGTKVYLACQPVSMRLGFDGLAARVSQVLRADPFSGHLFLFRGKRADYLKLLHYDGTGLCLFANYVASHCSSFRWRLAFWSGTWEEAAALSARRSHRLECFTGRLFSGSS